jgi:hypothetical protein
MYVCEQGGLHRTQQTFLLHKFKVIQLYYYLILLLKNFLCTESVLNLSDTIVALFAIVHLQTQFNI